MAQEESQELTVTKQQLRYRGRPSRPVPVSASKVICHVGNVKGGREDKG